MPIGRHAIIIFSASAVAVLSMIILNTPALTRWPLISPSVADLVVSNATIFTADPSCPFAEALAVKNGRILRVGTYDSVRNLIRPNTHILDLKGRVVTPGFIDSHVHFISGGLQMAHIKLHGVRTRDEFVRKVKEGVEGKHQGEWVLGSGWNNDGWGGDLPAASWIDNITLNNPVWLYRMDGHMALANSFALNITGITMATPDPVGGSIIKDARGEPTGVLIDSAMKFVLSIVPEISIHERRDALVRASKHALSKGVTTVNDFGRFFPGTSVEHVWQDFIDVYQWADSRGKMLIRACLFFPMQTWSRLSDLVHQKGRFFSSHLYLGGVKAFADGSLGSSSALFYQSYIGEPDNYGLEVTDMDWLLNVTLASDRSGLQVAIHAIGDKANDMVLDMYNTVASLNGKRNRRFRVEHAQHLTAGASARFGQQEVIASVQPQQLLYDADSVEKKIGAERALNGPYMFKSLLSNNVVLAFGSDWPVVDISPLEAMRTAMKRIPPGWKNAWNPSECVAWNDAVLASTISAAYSSFIDGNVGSLSSGKLADFVVLSAQSWHEFKNDPSTLIFATYVGGIQAYP